MTKVRVYELARKLGFETKKFLEELKKLGVDVRSHMSTLDEETVILISESLTGKEAKEEKKEEKEKEKEKEKEGREEEEEEEERKKLHIKEGLTVGALAGEMNVKPNEIIKKLMKKNIFASLNDSLRRKTIEIAAKEFGFEIEIPEPEKKVVPVEKEEEEEAEEEDVTKLVPRSPIVTVMGHVNHGKTSLLDAIRDTKVAEKERGGITQHIGASKVKLEHGEVVFLDTPGHEAFTAMRARGAQVTDIVILVVAADDGIMPQTVEAIDHARAAEVPIVVAINKIDRADANPDRIKQQLQEHDLVAEDFGGKTVCVNVSAIKKEGLNDLLEVLLLEAEMLELKANPEGPARGTVIEAKLDKQRGPVITVLISKGTLKVGDFFVGGLLEGKVRAILNDKGKRVKEAPPSTPVELLGSSGIPNAGDSFRVFRTEKEAKETALKKRIKKREEELRPAHLSLDQLYEQIQAGLLKELKIVVKADTQGSAEALIQSITELGGEEVKVNIIHSGAGEITESDVMLASASNAIIIGFHIGQGEKAKQLNKEENIDIRMYHVIYDAISDIKKALEGLLEPEIIEIIMGKAEVRQVFDTSKGEIAGSYVTEGKIVRDCAAKILREDKEIHRSKVQSLRRFKESVKEVETGFECGIMIAGFDQCKEGDIIEIFTREIKGKSLSAV